VVIIVIEKKKPFKIHIDIKNKSNNVREEEGK